MSESGSIVPDGAVIMKFKSKTLGTSPNAMHIMITPHTYFISSLTFPISGVAGEKD